MEYKSQATVKVQFTNFTDEEMGGIMDETERLIKLAFNSIDAKYIIDDVAVFEQESGKHVATRMRSI